MAEDTGRRVVRGLRPHKQLVQRDNPNDLADGPGKFGPYCDYRIYPVIDIAETARHAQQRRGLQSIYWLNPIVSGHGLDSAQSKLLLGHPMST
jgi:hypothetical protein